MFCGAILLKDELARDILQSATFVTDFIDF